MYHIHTDASEGIIHIAIEGFWTVETVAAFARDLRDAAAALARTGQCPALLYDYTRAIIQSQEVVAALQDIARQAPAGARKVAIFTEGRLARRQAARVASTNDRVTVFEDRGAAMAWLAAA